MNTTILLADDHKLLREGLRTLIGGQFDMTVVAEAEDGTVAVELAEKMSPDIVIMDISMPGVNGIEATRRILSGNTASKVIALSMHLEKRMILEMLCAGASGYLLKDCAFEEIVHAVSAVASDRAYLSRRVAEVVLKDYIQRTSKDDLFPCTDPTPEESEILELFFDGADPEEIASLLNISLSAARDHLHRIVVNHIVPRLRSEKQGGRTVCLTIREKEILRWVKDGKNTWDIASILGISRDTVKFHLKKVFHKLNVSSRSQVVAMAIELKLIDF
jgi:DNA-binding NarL/FixJ family response regulator